MRSYITKLLVPVFFLMGFSTISFMDVFAQCDTSLWKASVDPGGGGATTDVLPASSVFQSGVLTVTPTASFPSPYYVTYTLKDTFCITNNFSVEIRLKNDPASGGAVAGDTWIGLKGSGITAGCLLVGLPTSQQYTILFVGNSSVSNIPQLVMDLSSWRTIRLDFINNVVNWSYDGANFFSMNYSGSICNINNLSVGFREAGEVDYIKIFDAGNSVVYYEEFLTCNSIETAPDCTPPDVTSSSANAVYCEGDSIKLTGSSSALIQYNWTGPNSFTSTLQNPVISNALPSHTGWYKLTGYVNPCTPANKDSVYITVNPKKVTNTYPSICQGDFYTAGGNNQTTAGNYYDTLATSMGCDSIIITSLAVLPTSATAVPVSICLGDSFFVAGNYQKLAGTYYDTLQNYTGCDSVITTSLSLITPLYQNQNIYICQGDSLFVGGTFQKLPGIFNDTTTATTGCDSIIITNLSVIAPINTTLDISICEGQSYLAGGALQTQPGVYLDTLSSLLGCDSIITTNLQVIVPVFGNRSVFICENDSFFVGGAFQTNAGSYIDTILSSAGCDSILTTDLQLIPPVYNNIDAFICQGDSMMVGGDFQTQSGYYNDTLTTSVGCDSIVITHLQLIAPVYSTITQHVCMGDSFFVGGNYQTQAGNYYDTLQSYTGCDSILTTQLEIVAPISISLNVAICNGSSYFAGGSLQTTAGTYSDTLQSALGCDSVVITQLQVILPVYGSKNVSICDGQSYYAGGGNQTIAGNYVDTLVSANGCDSILTTQLTVLPNPMVYLGQDTTLCEGTSLPLTAGSGFSTYLWSDGSHNDSYDVTDVGIYWVIITDQNGCIAADTLVVTDVFPNPENFLPADTAVCGKFARTISVPGFISYSWSNNLLGDTATISAPGIYTLQVTDVNGCIGTDAITFEAVCALSILMPNAFTPNGDGLNDILKPVLLDDINNYELKIFNRWGKLIFYSKNPDEGWDGRENSIASPIEEYVWTARYKNGNGEEQFERGSVALLR